MLKKELAEMRANQALAEDKNIQSLTSLDREVGRARGLMATTNAEADMERSAHRETMEALEASENSVRMLVRTIIYIFMNGFRNNLTQLFSVTLCHTSPGFYCLQYRPLKTLWVKEKLLVTSNFFLTHSVFCRFRELSAIFVKFEIVVCKVFQFGRV